MQKSFLVLCGIGALAFLSYDVVRNPVIPLFARDLGAGPQEIGFIVAASTITGIFFKLPSGILSDLLGRKQVLLFSLLVFTGAPFFYLLVHGTGGLTALRFFHGLATASFAPAAMAAVATLYGERRGEFLGWFSSAMQTGKMAGRLMGGYLLLWVGFQDSFLIAALFGGLGFLFVLSSVTIPSKIASHSLAMTHVRLFGGLLSGIKEVTGKVTILATSGMQAVEMMAVGAFEAFLPIYAVGIGFHAGQVGLLLAAEAMTSLLSKPIMGRLSDVIGRQILIIGSVAVSALALSLMPLTGRFLLLLLLAALLGVGDAVMTSSSSALVADLSREKSLGSAMGVFGTVQDIGHAGGPILAGILIASFGYGLSFSLIGGLLMGAAVIYFFVMKGEGQRASS